MTDTTESLRAVLNNWSPSYGGVPATEEAVLAHALASALARLEVARLALEYLERNGVRHKGAGRGRPRPRGDTP